MSVISIRLIKNISYTLVTCDMDPHAWAGGEYHQMKMTRSRRMAIATAV